jgi:hypothetical protein
MIYADFLQKRMTALQLWWIHSNTYPRLAFDIGLWATALERERHVFT